MLLKTEKKQKKKLGTYPHRAVRGRRIWGVTVWFARNHTDWWRWPPAARSKPDRRSATQLCPVHYRRLYISHRPLLPSSDEARCFSQWWRRKTSGDCAAYWLFPLSGCWTLASWESNTQPWLEAPWRLYGPIPLVCVSVARASIILSFVKEAVLRFVFVPLSKKQNKTNDLSCWVAVLEYVSFFRSLTLILLMSPLLFVLLSWRSQGPFQVLSWFMHKGLIKSTL